MPGNGLAEGIVLESRSFFRVKAQGMASLAVPGNDLAEGIVLENFFAVRVLYFGGG